MQGNAHMSQADYEGIKKFIDDWKDCEPTIDCSGWEDFLKKFSSLRESDLSSGNYVDFYGSGLLGKSEMNFSAVLAWLLRNNVDHGFGDSFFRNFMQLAGFEVKKYDGYSVRTENVLDKKSRADIIIEHDAFAIIIEVKVEGDDKDKRKQLPRYKKWLNEKRGLKKTELVFLTKSGKDAGVAKSVKDAGVVLLAWRDVGRSFLNVLNDLENDRTSNSISAEIVRQFCHKLLTFY